MLYVLVANYWAPKDRTIVALWRPPRLGQPRAKLVAEI